MTPYATIGSATIYHGKMQDVLPTTGLPIIQTVISDPPYWGNAYAQRVKIGMERWTVEGEAMWQAQIIEEYVSWLPAIYQAIEYAQGRAWFFASPNHLPALVRTASCLGWTLQRIWFQAGAYGLVQFGRPISDRSAERVTAAFHDSPHGARIDGNILNELLRASDPDGLVLDPFMGQGGTLVHAAGMGMASVGIEKDQADCEIAAEKLRALERAA